MLVPSLLFYSRFLSMIHGGINTHKKLALIPSRFHMIALRNRSLFNSFLLRGFSFVPIFCSSLSLLLFFFSLDLLRALSLLSIYATYVRFLLSPEQSTIWSTRYSRGREQEENENGKIVIIVLVGLPCRRSSSSRSSGSWMSASIHLPWRRQQ